MTTLAIVFTIFIAYFGLAAIFFLILAHYENLNIFEEKEKAVGFALSVFWPILAFVYICWKIYQKWHKK